ncbi:MAG TPA: DUF6498-containing protein [Thermoanaerobaculia bacterium]
MRVTQLVGVTSVPVVGVVWAGWTNATALVLYWYETLLLILLVAVRIHLHRTLTKKRGHYCEVLMRSTTNGRTTTRTKIGYFGTSFLIFALAFWLGSGIFLGFTLRDDQLGAVDHDELRAGLAVTAILLSLGLFIDMVGLRERPFAWISMMSRGVLWRVFLVQIAIFAGFVGAGMLGLPRSALIAFVFLKLYTDITSQLPNYYDPQRAPRWTVKLFGRSFAEQWRRDKAAETALEKAEEEIFDGRPMPFEQTFIHRIDG